MSVITENLSQGELIKITKLCALDWELKNADTRYYTHEYHTYPSKYISKIPNHLISIFSEGESIILLHG